VLKRFAAKRAITFPLLSDSGSQVIEAFGIRNQEAKGSRIDGVPHPGTFIVDSEGTIVAKLFHEGYKKRHTSLEILTAVEALRSE
jgi:peroxiredoxin